MANDPYVNYLLVLLVHSFVRKSPPIMSKWGKTLITVIMIHPVHVTVYTRKAADHRLEVTGCMSLITGCRQRLNVTGQIPQVMVKSISSSRPDEGEGGGRAKLSAPLFFR